MSLERTALRLAMVMALSGGMQAPFPTIARGRVFDSRMDPRQITDLEEVMPLITVCTDDDAGDSMSDNNGGPPFRHDQCQIVLEASIGVIGEDEEKNQQAIVPQTEPELEALLDLMERQVKRALADPLSPWVALLSKTHRGLMDWKSHKFVEPDSNVRLAARRMIITARLPVEDLFPTEADTIPAPLGPLLEAIIASGSPYAADAQAMQAALLAAGAGAGLILPRLERVRMYDLVPADGAPAPTDDGGGLEVTYDPQRQQPYTLPENWTGTTW